MNRYPQRFRSLSPLIGGVCLGLLATACSEEDPTIIDPEGGSGGQTANTGGSGTSTAGMGGSGMGGSGTGGSSMGGSGTGGSGMGGSTGTDNVVEVSGEITADTTWTADNTYILNEMIFVSGDSTLTIEAGTTIKGGGMGSALVVTRGSRVEAVGTAEDPIVFTSNVAEGQRAAGNWAGVVLLGSAPINVEGGEDGIEGIDVGEDRGLFGGTDAAHDCGTLSYVRIEFAGFEIADGNELNGLTVGGCGSATTLDHIQVHRGLDDGVEFFGGTTDIKNVVLSNNDDDSIDWDFGWTGRVQFAVIRHDTVHSDSGFESDSNPTAPYDQMPRSAPQIYNLTMVGNEGSTTGPAMNLRRGTWGTIRNGVVTGFLLGGVDVRDAASVAGTAEMPPALTVENTYFFNNGAGNAIHFGPSGTGALEPADGSADDDDAGFDEAAFFTDAARNNVVGTDPQLTDPLNVTAPNFLPAAGSPLGMGGATPPDDGFFDDAATYIGALPVGGPDWTTGWTSYPEN